MTRILLAFSDTGGGHRAAAAALRDALSVARPDADIALVDPFASCPRWPFRTLSDSYPAIVERAPWLWHAGFRLTNSTRRTHTIQRAAWPAMRATFQALAATHAPDVIVCTHPLLTTPLRRVFPFVPIVVTVTDLVTGHVSWYDRHADLTILPTPEARAAALSAGLTPDTLAVDGVPIARQYVAVPGEIAALRERLGWSERVPTILLAGGADGVGALESLAIAIDRATLPCELVVVAGRNARLARRLRSRRWHGETHVHDFVSNMGEFMRAASALVTKAGPGTISEACASGCPLVLHSAIPGQETGNVDFVVRGRAGVWAPSPLAVTAALHAWLVGRDAPAALRRASMAAMRIAKPEAAATIAQRVLTVADTGRSTTRARDAAA